MVAAAMVSGFSGCKKDSDSGSEDGGTKNYGLVVSAGTPAASYILNASELSQGTLTTAGNGAESAMSIVAQRGAYFYGINSDRNLVKFSASNKSISIVKEIPFTQISWAGYSSFTAWKDNSTLVLFSMNAARQFEYATLNTESMTITASGNVNIPLPADGKNYWGNNAVFLGNKLYLNYCDTDASSGLPDQGVYLASMDFPNVNNVTITQDNRFKQPAHYNLNTPGTFVDNGYAYFLSAPTIWIAGETGGSFSIYRVANGSTSIDANYQFELTDRTREEASCLFYAGNGKAIVQIIDKTQLSSWQDYGSKYLSDYYVVDVIARTKTKIDMPKSIPAPYSNHVLIDGNIVSIAASTADGFYVYRYDMTSGNLTRGAKLEGVNSLSWLVKF